MSSLIQNQVEQEVIRMVLNLQLLGPKKHDKVKMPVRLHYVSILLVNYKLENMYLFQQFNIDSKLA